MQAIQFYENLEDCDYFLLLENKNNPDSTVFVVENGIIPPFQCVFPPTVADTFSVKIEYVSFSDATSYDLTGYLSITKAKTASGKYVIHNQSDDVSGIAAGRLFYLLVTVSYGEPEQQAIRYSQVMCNQTTAEVPIDFSIIDNMIPPVFKNITLIDCNNQ